VLERIGVNPAQDALPLVAFAVTQLAQKGPVRAFEDQFPTVERIITNRSEPYLASVRFLD